MPGSVVDLSVAGSAFPNPIVVDTNLIVEYLVAPYIPILPVSPVRANAQRAVGFFRTLFETNGTGIVTPIAFTELVHAAVKARYNQERLRLGPSASGTSGRPIRDWLALYKQDETILQAFLPDLEELRRSLVASGLLFLAPDDLAPIVSGRSFDEELVYLVGTYGLDSSDALLLMEAQRCGVRDIVTLDADLQRARMDFTIYTWLWRSAIRRKTNDPSRKPPVETSSPLGWRQSPPKTTWFAGALLPLLQTAITWKYRRPASDQECAGWVEGSPG